MDTLLQIKSAWFTAGLIIENDLCMKAAPIIKYMIGWHHKDIFKYCHSRHWKSIHITNKQS